MMPRVKPYKKKHRQYPDYLCDAIVNRVLKNKQIIYYLFLNFSISL